MAAACLLYSLAAACASPAAPVSEFPGPPGRDHFTWVETRCLDGKLPLAQLGFEQRLRATPVAGGVELLIDTQMVDRGCSDLTALLARPDDARPGRWLLQLEARLTLPHDARCGPVPQEIASASIEARGEELRLTIERSPWCRGFDATIRYRVTDAPAVDGRALIRRYLLHFARRDAAAVSRLFAEQGSLVEPFSAEPTGRTTRHRGRQQVHEWLAGALAGPRWVALRVHSLERSGEAGEYIARWEYMDDALSTPVVGRNLFVVADGEIFETELQLLSIPRPLMTAVAGDASVQAARLPDAGS